MFYWFYKTTHPDGYRDRPIVLWLQGGPCLSGTGLGNFLMFGPSRPTSKTKKFHMDPDSKYTLCGLSREILDLVSFDNSSKAPTTMGEITEDLVTFIKTFHGRT